MRFPTNRRGLASRLAALRALCISAAVVATLAPAPVAAQDPDSVIIQRGRELTKLFYDREYDRVVASFNDEMRAALGGAAGLGSFREQLAGQVGNETEVITENVSTSGEYRVYRRSVRFSGFGGTLAVVWTFAGDGMVAGFLIQPEQGSPQEAPTEFLDYETRTALQLPFDDEWTVVWGGRTVGDNYHAAYADQRFAYDLLVTKDGRTHAGDGRDNSDYHCYGRTIVAPGDGTVVIARDGLADNTPGELDSSVPPGNHVVIDHGNGEFSFLAHFMQNSVQVSVGERVAAGAVLGQCGNSGRSSEPHLHYHLQTSPAFGRGDGLPAQFLNYIADDLPVRRGEPVRGQRIRPA